VEGGKLKKMNLQILKNRFGGRCLEVDQASSEEMWRGVLWQFDNTLFFKIEMLFQPSTLIHTLVEVTK
jgi:hypothetical protein